MCSVLRFPVSELHGDQEGSSAHSLPVRSHGSAHPITYDDGALPGLCSCAWKLMEDENVVAMQFKMSLA